MKCPIDPTIDLVMTERSGIEIDYCPTCRGVWLDRGELDKIIERNVATPAPAAAAVMSPAAPVAAAPVATAPPPQKRWDDDWDDDRRRAEGGYEYDKKYKKKKRSSFLEEIFDF